MISMIVLLKIDSKHISLYKHNINVVLISHFKYYLNLVILRWKLSTTIIISLSFKKKKLTDNNFEFNQQFKSLFLQIERNILIKMLAFLLAVFFSVYCSILYENDNACIIFLFCLLKWLQIEERFLFPFLTHTLVILFFFLMLPFLS